MKAEPGNSELASSRALGQLLEINVGASLPLVRQRGKRSTSIRTKQLD
jgi:hypothetical protein